MQLCPVLFCYGGEIGETSGERWRVLISGITLLRMRQNDPKEPRMFCIQANRPLKFSSAKQVPGL